MGIVEWNAEIVGLCRELGGLDVFCQIVVCCLPLASKWSIELAECVFLGWIFWGAYIGILVRNEVAICEEIEVIGHLGYSGQSERVEQWKYSEKNIDQG